MSEPASDNQFLPKPLSVHGMTEEAFRRSFRREMRTLPLVAVGMVLTIVVLLAFDACGSERGVDIRKMLVLSVGTAVLCPSFVFLRFWLLRRVEVGTVYQLWSDRIVSRVDGRPPLVIQKDQVCRMREDRHGCLTIKDRNGRTMVLKCELANFSALKAALLSWPLAPRTIRVRWRLRVLAFVLTGGVLACGAVSRSVPVMIVGGLMCIALYTGWIIVDSKAKHRDRVSYWLQLGICVALIGSTIWAMVVMVRLWLGL